MKNNVLNQDVKTDKSEIEGLREQLAAVVAERDAALNAERIWETAMMEVCGEDGPASVAAFIKALVAENGRLCKRITHAEGCFSATIFEGLNEALIETSGSNLADIVSRRIVYAFPSIGEQTPATDAAVRRFHAEGVEKAIARLMHKFADTGNIGVPVMALEHLAKELRDGEHSQEVEI